MSDRASAQVGESERVPESDGTELSAQNASAQSSTMRRAARQFSRWALTIVTVVSLGAFGWALTEFALPGVDLSRHASSVVPESVESTRVCAAGLRSGGSMTTLDAGDAIGTGEISAISDADLTVQSLGQQAPETLSPAGQAAFREGLSASTTVRTGNDHESALGALSAARVDADQTRGSILTDCTSPAFDSWIGGGSQQVGRSTSVRLVNPSSLASTVTLTVFTGEGQLLTDTSELSVEAGTERVLPISALTNTDQQIFVRVQAVRAPVAAFLQQTTVRVLDAGGADVQSPGSSPSTRQTITGLRITGREEQAGLAGENGWEDTQPVLRLLSPDFGNVAHVSISGDDERSFDVALTQGVVSDTPLGDLPDGDYQITVTADAPVVSAARLTSGGREQPDFTWLQSADPVSSPVSFAVPQGISSASLQIGGTAGATVEVQVSGASRDVHLGDAGMGSVDVSAGQVVTVRPDQTVHLSLVTTAAGGIAATTLTSADAAGAVDILAR